ncbi:MAG: C40 family peptidase [Pseudonocardiales bacterium]|nr:C40 family peptidase [Pseudonocardiales bacterium]MBV9028835.1 C40 family peptidase [Pseudonocardiales bacterium]
MVVLGAVLVTPAAADPVPPGDAITAAQQLADLNRQAEVLTERWHYTLDQLSARRAELERARADVNAAAAAAERARAVQGQYRGQVDRLTNASFEGARLSRLSALLVSDSPQDFLDQMSVLDMLAVDNKQALDRLTGAVAQAQQAEQSADNAAARAGQAERDAAQLEGDLAGSRAEMDRQIQVVTKRLAQLTRQERAAYTAGGNIHFPINLVGSGISVMAARAALSKQGSAYVWGGDGPITFDCSGLVKWAFAQAGMPGLPHSAEEQARMGRAVSRSELQPGDLIALYSPISHIGIYVGDGLYVNAPQSGDVVKVVWVPWSQVTAMSRIG